MKSLITLETFGREDAERLVDRALIIKSEVDEGRAVQPSLQGRSVANLFFEPSTRTRLSFELAAKRLGAHVITFNPTTSSAVKGESLRDTVMTIDAIGADLLVVRHAESGVPLLVEEWTGAGVVNAGDGSHAHPTQALLDAVTLTSRFGGVEGLNIGVVGDVSHSRVAASLARLMPTLGATLTYVAPPNLQPREIPDGVAVCEDLDDALSSFDVVYLLRVQLERGASIDDQYQLQFGLDASRASRMGSDSVIMHPGPLNRGVEISPDVADGPRSLILSQVAHGVPTRMAVLEEIALT